MPTAVSAPLISLGRTNYRRLEALAKQAGRTPQTMISFVLRDGFDYCEHVVRETARGLADAKAGRLIPHGQAMAALGHQAGMSEWSRMRTSPSLGHGRSQHPSKY